MTQDLWNEKKAHFATQRQALYWQQEWIKLAARIIEIDECALGPQWVDPNPPPAEAPPAEA